MLVQQNTPASNFGPLNIGNILKQTFFLLNAPKQNPMKSAGLFPFTLVGFGSALSACQFENALDRSSKYVGKDG